MVYNMEETSTFLFKGSSGELQGSLVLNHMENWAPNSLKSGGGRTKVNL